MVTDPSIWGYRGVRAPRPVPDPLYQPMVPEVEVGGCLDQCRLPPLWGARLLSCLGLFYQESKTIREAEIASSKLNQMSFDKEVCADSFVYFGYKFHDFKDLKGLLPHIFVRVTVFCIVYYLMHQSRRNHISFWFIPFAFCLGKNTAQRLQQNSCLFIDLK